MPDRVDTTVNAVPVPRYYLVRNESGLWHLIDPVEYGKVEHGDSNEVSSRCDRTITVERSDELMHVTDWLDITDVVEEYTADELWDEFKPFAGQCKQCLKSHQANGATDSARLEVPDDYSPPRDG